MHYSNFTKNENHKQNDVTKNNLIIFKKHKNIYPDLDLLAEESILSLISERNLSKEKYNCKDV